MKKTQKVKTQETIGLPHAGSPEMTAYTEEQLNQVFEHRTWTNPHPEALTDEDVKQGLLLIAQSTEIQKVFIRLRNQYTQAIVKASHKAMSPENVKNIERLGIKHDMLNKILDRVENIWRARQKQNRAVDNLPSE